MFGKKKAEEVKQDDSQQKQETSEKKRSGVISVVMISIMAAIFIAVALIMLFVKDATVTYICYAICGAAIIVGIFAIVRYFLIKAYCDLNEYGFAEGVLLVSLGICGLIKVDAIAGVFITVVGIALLISGVIKLQSALALRMMNDVLWFLVLIISVVIIGFSMFVLLKPDMDQIYTWYVLLVDGVLSLVNVIYQFFRIKAYNSAEMKAVEQSKNDMRDKILKEQEDMRLAKEEQRKAELEQKAASPSKKLRLPNSAKPSASKWPKKTPPSSTAPVSLPTSKLVSSRSAPRSRKPPPTTTRKSCKSAWPSWPAALH